MAIKNVICPVCKGDGHFKPPKKGTGKQVDIDGRFSYAAKALRNDGYTIRQIAKILGFKNPGSISNLLNK